MKKILLAIISVSMLFSYSVFAAPSQIHSVEALLEIPERAVSNESASMTSALVEFDSGNGSQSAPYVISTAEQLLGVADVVENKSSALYFSLANDIDLNGAEWVPIGTGTAPFGGAFLGNGHTISNFKITSDHTYNGFFGLVKEADISKLAIENMSIDLDCSTGSEVFAGLLFGSAYKEKTNANLTNTFSEISVSGSINITHSAGSVYAGGIAGKMEAKTGNYIISNCISLVDIDAASSTKDVYAGGILGSLQDILSGHEMKVEKSYYSGSCNASAKKNVYCAGIAGLIRANTGWSSGWYGSSDAVLYADTEYSISNCFVDGSVFASSETLGVYIGRIHGAEHDGAAIKNCAYIETQSISAIAAQNPYTNFTGKPSRITADKVVSSSYLSNTLDFNLLNIWQITENATYPSLICFNSTAPESVYEGDINVDGKIDESDLEIFAKLLAGINLNLTDDQLIRANVYTSQTDSQTDLKSNLNIKDLILLSQYVAGKNVTLG